MSKRKGIHGKIKENESREGNLKDRLVYKQPKFDKIRDPRIPKSSKIKVVSKKLRVIKNGHKCPVCFNVYAKFKDILMVHIRNYHSRKLFKCNKCLIGDLLSVDSYYLHYLKVHFNKKGIDGTYDCIQKNCKQSFSTFSSLKKHTLTHEDTKKYTCDKCGRKFNTQNTLIYHDISHEGDLYKCLICKKVFLKREHYKYHMWLHEKNVKEFDNSVTCSPSEQLVNDNNKYDETEEANYLCNICEKPFLQADHLEYHMRYHHYPRSEQYSTGCAEYMNYSYEYSERRREINVYSQPW